MAQLIIGLLVALLFGDEVKWIGHGGLSRSAQGRRPRRKPRIRIDRRR